MKVSIIGTGYVGLVAGACLADTGHDVVCVDIDEAKVKRLNDGEIPIYEPGLEELVRLNRRADRLHFTSDVAEAVQQSLINFIAVGTPQGEDGSADLANVLSVARAIGQAMESQTGDNRYKIIVTKSTVPVGTGHKVAETIRSQTDQPFDVVSNPEFLKEGAAVNDFMNPDRVVIGTSDPRVAELMKELYSPYVRTGNPIMVMDILSAEMTKYAANTMLAVRISFMNEIANLCDLLGADVDMVRRGVGSDKRIGPSFLFPGIGYGGSCFPKDVVALSCTAREAGYEFKIVEATDRVNAAQKHVLVEKIKRRFGDDLSGLSFAIWGLSFKPRTDDMRDAPSIVVINELREAGAVICAYDPAAHHEARRIFGESLCLNEKRYEVLDGCDGLVICTEWNEFREPDFAELLERLKQPIIFDGRNLFDPPIMKKRGFEYYCIGRPTT